MQSDGYSVYGSYCNDCGEKVNASRRAQVPRKFVEALEAGKTCAAPASNSSPNSTISKNSSDKAALASANDSPSATP